MTKLLIEVECGKKLCGRPCLVSYGNCDAFKTDKFSGTLLEWNERGCWWERCPACLAAEQEAKELSYDHD